MEILKAFSVIILLVGFANGQTDVTPSDDFECPNNDDGTFPHPTDCTKYFVCTNGLAWEEHCPDGLFFDPISLQCNWPDLVNCNGASPPPTTTTTPVVPSSDGTTEPGTVPTGEPTSEPPFTLSTYEPSSVVPTEPTSEPPYTLSTYEPSSVVPTEPSTDTPTTPSSGDFQCPSPDGSFPNPEDCNLYYVCQAGEAIPEACPPGLWFDPTLLVCNYPELVNCAAAP